MAQMVKNLPAVWETWVRFLGWQDPLEKGKATHSSILAWRIPWNCKESDTTEVLSLLTNGGGGVVTKSCPTLVTPWTVTDSSILKRSHAY